MLSRWYSQMLTVTEPAGIHRRKPFCVLLKTDGFQNLSSWHARHVLTAPGWVPARMLSLVGSNIVVEFMTPKRWGDKWGRAAEHCQHTFPGVIQRGDRSFAGRCSFVALGQSIVTLRNSQILKSHAKRIAYLPHNSLA